METCENCGRIIGKLETPRLFDHHVICAECDARLRPRAVETISYASRESSRPASTEIPYRALGLETRGAAWTIGLIGLFLSPALVGIPLAVWGFIADSMLRRHYGIGGAERSLSFVVTMIVLLFVGIFALVLLYNNQL